MENYIDDYGAYLRLKALTQCPCGCGQHCRHSCMTDDCDCTECGCARCLDDLARSSSDVQKA